MYNTYIIAVKSEYAKEAIILLDSTETKLKTLQDITVIIGATAAKTGGDALRKLAKNHELPETILTYFQVS